MPWSHRSETHLDKLQTSDFLITDGSIEKWNPSLEPGSLNSRSCSGASLTPVWSLPWIYFENTPGCPDKTTISCAPPRCWGYRSQEQQQLGWKGQRRMTVTNSAPPAAPSPAPDWRIPCETSMVWKAKTLLCYKGLGKPYLKNKQAGRDQQPGNTPWRS